VAAILPLSTPRTSTKHRYQPATPQISALPLPLSRPFELFPARKPSPTGSKSGLTTPALTRLTGPSTTHHRATHLTLCKGLPPPPGQFFALPFGSLLNTPSQVNPVHATALAPRIPTDVSAATSPSRPPHTSFSTARSFALPANATCARRPRRCPPISSSGRRQEGRPWRNS
jgi:hypothetical protein